MKKSLIALAAVAVVGTAYAQSTVSLTGKLRFGYANQSTGAGGKATGIGVTDGDWNIAVVEDLGGGLQAGANMALRLRGRDAATDTLSGGSATDGNGARPRDSSMFLSGAFGRVLVGAIEANNANLAGVTAGGPTFIGLDSSTATTGVVSAATNSDILQYSTPAMNGLTARVALLDNVGGGGAQAQSTAQDAVLYGVNYSAGPLAMHLDWTSYGDNTAAIPRATNRLRANANYNLGVARVGVGYQTGDNVTTAFGAGATQEELLLAVSIPVGNVLLGGVYGQRTLEGVTGTATGYDLAAQYNLSKRTYVALQYRSTKQPTAGAPTDQTTQIQLSHSF